MKIIVTGACGWIGRAVVAQLEMLGIEAVGIDMLDESGITLRGDIGSDSLLDLAGHPMLAGAAAVIHCAGHAHRPRETLLEAAKFDQINRLGTMRVIRLATRLEITRIVYVSSIAFYDWSRGGAISEDGPVLRQSAYAASKLDGEVACSVSGLDYRVVRLGTVFGTGDRANFAKLATAMRNRRFFIPGSGVARKSVIPIDLVAELVTDLAIRTTVMHRVMNLALPVCPTLSSICDSYSKLCGFGRVPHIPCAIVRPLALCGDFFERIRPEVALTTRTVGKLTVDTEVDVGRMRSLWSEKKWPTFEEALKPHAPYYRSLC